MSRPHFHIHIVVREGSLNKDHQGRETRSVSIETVPCSDFEISPKAAGSVQPRVEFTLGENIFEFFGCPLCLYICDKGHRTCKEKSGLKAALYQADAREGFHTKPVDSRPNKVQWLIEHRVICFCKNKR